MSFINILIYFYSAFVRCTFHSLFRLQCACKYVLKHAYFKLYCYKIILYELTVYRIKTLFFLNPWMSFFSTIFWISFAYTYSYACFDILQFYSFADKQIQTPRRIEQYILYWIIWLMCFMRLYSNISEGLERIKSIEDE